MVLRIADGKILQDNDLDAIIAGSNKLGVISGMATTASGTPDMDVHVALGYARVNGTYVTKVGTTDLTITTAHATYPRKDIITLSSAGTFTVTAGTPEAESGTPSPTPAPANIPANEILIAEIYVAANVTTITNADITDKRVNVFDSVLRTGDTGMTGAYTITQASNANALTLAKSGTGSGDVLAITNAGTGYGINVSQTGVGFGIYVSQAANADALNIAKSATGTGALINLSNSGTGVDISGTSTNWTISKTGAITISEGTNETKLSITKSGIGAGNAIAITNSGTGYDIGSTFGSWSITSTGVFAINYGGNETKLSINKSGTGSGDVVSIINAGTSRGISISQSGEGNGIFVNKTSTGGSAAVQISNAGVGNGLYLLQSGDATGLYVNKSGTGTGALINLANSGTGKDISGTSTNWTISKTGAITISEVTDETKLSITKSGTGAGNVVSITNAGTGYGIYLNNSGTLAGGNAALVIISSVAQTTAAGLVNFLVANASTSSPVLKFSNQGTGVDISGSGGYWTISKTGAITSNDTSGQNETKLSITKSGTGAGSSILVTHAGTNVGLDIASSSSHYGLRVTTSAGYPAYFKQEATNGNVLELNHSAAGTGNVLDIANSGTGYDIDGSSSKWYITKTGAITISDATDETKLSITKSGTGAGDVVSITNAGTGRGINIYKSGTTGDTALIYGSNPGHILQVQSTGVSDAFRYTLYVLSNVAQINAPLCSFQMNSASSTTNVIDIINAGTGKDINGTSSNWYISKTGAITISEATNETKLYITKSGTGSGDGINITNSGTGKAIFISQTGDQVALQINQTINNKNIYLAKTGTGTGTVLDISNAGTGDSIMIYQSGVLAGGNALLQVQAGAGSAQTTGAGLVYIQMINRSSTIPCIKIDNAGTGYDISGNNTNWTISKTGAITISEATNETKLSITKSGTGAGNVVSITNAGTGNGIYVNKSGTGTGNAVYLTNVGSDPTLAFNTTGTSAYDIYGTGVTWTISKTGAIAVSESTNENKLSISKTGTGTGSVVTISNSGTGLGISITQVGVLAASNNAFYIVGQGSQTTGDALVNFTFSGASTIPVLKFANAGTGKDISGTSATWSVSKTGAITISEATNETKLSITKSGTGSGHVVYVANSGTGAGLYVNNVGAGTDGYGILINQEKNYHGLFIQKTSSGIGNLIQISNSGTGYDVYGTGGFWKISNTGSITISEATNETKLSITKSGTGAGNVVSISDAGTGKSLYVNQTHVGPGSGFAFQIDNAGDDCSIYVNHTGTLGAGQSVAAFYSATAQTAGDSILGVTAASASTTKPVIRITNSGTGYDIYGSSGNWRTSKTGDYILNDATKGVVLKDTQGSPHYWRITVNNSGQLVTADLGTTIPT